MSSRCSVVAAVTAVSAIVTAFTVVSPASAAILGFNESFTAGSANWRNSNGATDLAWFATGGPGGLAYASSTFNLSSTTVGGFPPTVIRAHASYGSSAGGYVGDWIAEGATGVTFLFRHDLTEAVTVTGRFATPTNAPGASAIANTVVLPNTWTLITFDLREGSPDIISLGGGTYQAIFSNIGNMQFGFTVPTALAGQNIDGHFDITDFTIVPAPGGAALMLLAVAARRRRR
jgi:hypothetical protein